MSAFNKDIVKLHLETKGHEVLSVREDSPDYFDDEVTIITRARVAGKVWSFWVQEDGHCGACIGMNCIYHSDDQPSWMVALDNVLDQMEKARHHA